MGRTNPDRNQTPWHYKAAYIILLAMVSGWILLIFLKPEPLSVGINQHDRSRFLDMVEGKAYKPYVYRTLLPTTTRVVAALTPEQVANALAATVENNPFLRGAFARFRW